MSERDAERVFAALGPWCNNEDQQRAATDALLPLLAELTAEAEQRGRAAGWDEGYHAGLNHASGGTIAVGADGEPLDHNPYRAALDPEATQGAR